MALRVVGWSVMVFGSASVMAGKPWGVVMVKSGAEFILDRILAFPLLAGIFVIEKFGNLQIYSAGIRSRSAVFGACGGGVSGLHLRRPPILEELMYGVMIPGRWRGWVCRR